MKKTTSKPKGGGALLPAKVKISFVSGADFEGIRRAGAIARAIGRVHPDIAEMGRRLIEKPGTECGVFTLGEPQFRDRAVEIEQAFTSGLRVVAKVLGPGGLSTRSTRNGDRLLFWYSPGGRPKVP